MKRLFAWFPAAVIFLAIPSLIIAQEIKAQEEDPRPYNALAESVTNAIKEQFPAWKRTSIPPPHPGGTEIFPDDVIIDQWKSDEAIVKVSILIHPSKEEAEKAFKEFVAGVKVNEPLQDVGSESYEWGISKSVAFREGRYTVFLSAAPIYVEGVPPESYFPPKEIKYNKIFAQIVAKVLTARN